jgi:UDP-N-acetylglucosamine diphosphorylase/glucosamine-1-phosphate N-acetyltransferase
MKKIVFTQEFCQPDNMFPFSLTRKVQDIRIGILTIRQKWELLLDMPSYDKGEEDYKDSSATLNINEAIGKDIIYLVHGNLLPTPKLLQQVKKLKPGEILTQPGRESIVYCISKNEIIDQHKINVKKSIDYDHELKEFMYPWDMVKLNAWAIEQDFEFLRKFVKGQRIPSSNKTINAPGIFIEKGASVEHCYLNASEGPIYIAKGALIMEGTSIRGPVSIGSGATVKMGARIYGATTIGPGCIVGGEIKNSIFFANSNKAHDGYLGDSVVGEWCNFGAGTSCSNIKNTASPVMVWTQNGPIDAGLKCGVMIGDYSRTAINTSINTGSVIGVCAHVFGTGLTPKYIPSFSWGSDGIERYVFDKALQDIAAWKSLKKENTTDREKFILKHIFDHY